MSTPVVRRVTADDADRLREIRLDALAADPEAFGSTLQRDEALPDEHWRVWAAASATGGDQAVFVGEAETGLVGLVAGFRDTARPRDIHLVSMWVASSWRGAGLGRRLVDALVTWARESDADGVTLWVTDQNDGARRLYEAVGFRSTGRTQPLPSHPQLTETELRLSLRPGRSDGGRLPAGYVELAPLTGERMDAYLAWAVANRAAALEAAGDHGPAAAEAAATRDLAGILDEPGTWVCALMAGIDDVLVGWLRMSEHPPTEAARIDDLFVFERHRGRGFGAAAVDEVEEWARMRGLRRVAVASLDASPDAEGFLRAVDFVADPAGGHWTRPVTAQR